MNMKMRRIKFWITCCLQILGCSAGAALLWFLFMSAGTREYSGSIVGAFWDTLALYPYYLLMAGAFLTAMLGVNYFQVYYSILLSMNATRAHIAKGIIATMLGIPLGILFLAGVIWKLLPGDISFAGWNLMPLFIGALLAVSALFMTLGVVIFRWGKNGVIFMIIVGMLIGAGAGAVFALSGSNLIVKFVTACSGGNFGMLAVAGILLYAAAGIFVTRATRKLEVRA